MVANVAGRGPLVARKTRTPRMRVYGSNDTGSQAGFNGTARIADVQRKATASTSYEENLFFLKGNRRPRVIGAEPSFLLCSGALQGQQRRTRLILPSNCPWSFLSWIKLMRSAFTAIPRTTRPLGTRESGTSTARPKPTAPSAILSSRPSRTNLDSIRILRLAEPMNIRDGALGRVGRISYSNGPPCHCNRERRPAGAQ